MEIICFGDLACPELSDVKIVESILSSVSIKDKIVIGNLEGLLVKNETNILEKNNTGLYNNENVLKSFKNTKKTIFTLANNHSKDYPSNYLLTKTELSKNNIGYCGIGDSIEEAIKPYEFICEGKKMAVFSHCWSVMGKIIKNKEKRIKVNDINYKDYINYIKQYRVNNQDCLIVVYFHWNLDFEELPFPAHVKIAHELIDNGVYAVLGSHSHLINGGEIYKNKLIIYGLGNFYIPSSKYYNKKLIYPEESKNNIVVQIDSKLNLYKLLYIEDNNIVKIETLNNNSIIKPYVNLDISKYKQYFKKNRKKSLLIPVLCNTNENIKEFIIYLRMRLIRKIKGIK